MKSYPGSEIRNVAVVGHAHSGKTTLVSALLHAAKMTPTLGRVEDGSAVTAYDEEDVARATTMQNAVAFAEWNGVKVNFIDTPGFHMFVHEARAAMAAGGSRAGDRPRRERRGGDDGAGVEIRRGVQSAPRHRDQSDGPSARGRIRGSDAGQR